MNELQWTNEKELYKNIPLPFYSRKGHTVYCKFDRSIERHILREGISSCPIFSSWSQGCERLHPLASHIVRDASDRLLRWLDSRFWLACLNLTAWFSYHVVSFRLHTCSAGLFRRTNIPLFTIHNVTAFQGTRGHQEQTQNPCQQSLYNSRG